MRANCQLSCGTCGDHQLSIGALAKGKIMSASSSIEIGGHATDASWTHALWRGLVVGVKAFIAYAIIVLVIAAIWDEERDSLLPPQLETKRYTQDFAYELFSLDQCLDSHFWICACSFCCVPIMMADNLSKTRSENKAPQAIIPSFWLALAFVLGILFLVVITSGLGWILAVAIAVYFRQRIRQTYGLPYCTSDVLAKDCISWCCCPWCTVAQETRQVQLVIGEPVQVMPKLVPRVPGRVLSAQLPSPQVSPRLSSSSGQSPPQSLGAFGTPQTAGTHLTPRSAARILQQISAPQTPGTPPRQISAPQTPGTPPTPGLTPSSGFSIEQLHVGMGGGDPTQEPARSQFLAKLGLPQQARVEKLSGNFGGQNEGIWVVQDPSTRSSLILKRVWSRNPYGLQMPSEATQFASLFREHPSIAHDPTIAFPIKVFKCIGQTGDNSHDLVVMRKVNGQHLGEVFAFMRSRGQMRDIMQILRQLGSFLARFHSSYSNKQHGDFQPSNIFYDASSGAFSLIDIANMGQARESDVLHFCESLRLLSNTFGPQFLSDGKRNFEEGYRSASYALPASLPSTPGGSIRFASTPGGSSRFGSTPLGSLRLTSTP
jgi:Cys-rich protein (TIGR01571 family)